MKSILYFQYLWQDPEKFSSVKENAKIWRKKLGRKSVKLSGENSPRIPSLIGKPGHEHRSQSENEELN